MNFADVRSQFPLIAKHPELVYLDSAATSQKPQVVLDALNDYYENHNANIHRGIYQLTERATTMFEEGREAMARFLNAADPMEIVFVRNATEAINLMAYGWVQQKLGPGDTMVTTIAEHHSNLVPWLVLRDKLGFDLKIVDLNEDEVVDQQQYQQFLDEHKPKFVAFNHVSNSLGNVNPVKEMTAAAKAVGAVVLLDACQSVPRMKIDVQDLGCDFLALSGHKMYGPMGIGCLYARMELMEQMEPWQLGGGMIESVALDGIKWAQKACKFEAGTPHVAGVVGLKAAIEFLEGIGMEQVWAHEQELSAYALEQLQSIDKLRVLGARDSKQAGGAFSFVVEGIHPFDLTRLLDEEDGVCMRSGQHCCNPLMTKLGISGTTRLSLGVYSNKEDIDRAIAAIKSAKELFC